ncbi:TPA: phage head-tail adapter protein [Klebsiella oxytoca]|uniref:Phage head-tail adapter protein n=1 Tax=Klebsiella oxytoca TaxID=571 RepID=A0AAN5LAW9_KLEOX|nr:phage head-tail adapter protein [Klebsiella oxytoca]
MFKPENSLLAGSMTRAQKQEALATAQQAYVELSTGARGVSFSYTQGDGTRSVTYLPAQLSDLMSFIQQLQAELGIVRRPRRALRFRY